MGGEQIDGPEGQQLTAASKQAPHESCGAGIATRRPGPNVAKAVVLWEETGKCTMGAVGVGVPALIRRDPLEEGQGAHIRADPIGNPCVRVASAKV
jgi:hypothetical protein